jgi:hypothetical protein
MLGKSFAPAIIFLCAASAATAQENCIAPFTPAIPDGTAATPEEMNAARENVMAFLRDSESYQNCMLVYIRQMEDEARRGDKPLDQQARSNIVNRVNANQRLKERTGEIFNTAVRAHNAVHYPAPEEENGEAASVEGAAGENAPQ